MNRGVNNYRAKHQLFIFGSKLSKTSVASNYLAPTKSVFSSFVSDTIIAGTSRFIIKGSTAHVASHVAPATSWEEKSKFFL